MEMIAENKDTKMYSNVNIMAIALASKRKTEISVVKPTVSPNKEDIGYTIDFSMVKPLDDLHVDHGMLEVMLSNTKMDKFVSSEIGLPHGTNLMISGKPGVGKTTILLNYIADIKKHSGKRVLFICAEMSKRMMLKYKLRFPKLGCIETMFPSDFEGQDLKKVYEKLFDNGYDLVLIDSVKELLAHIRCESKMTETAADTWLADLCVKHNYANNKLKKYTSFGLIQQVTKAGIMVGKNALKHITDGHLSLEMRKSKDGGGTYMIWEKNRNGLAGVEFSYSITENDVIYHGSDDDLITEDETE